MQGIGKVIKLFDGGMGSELERSGISFSHPEDLNIDAPELIRSIHRAYAEAGADFITTNTFGLNRIKYKGKYDTGALCRAAAENAGCASKQIFFDIGPTGALLKPLGSLAFDEAYEAFKEVVVFSRELVDGYILETFSDIYELKSAVLAVKENSDKPVIATMTFDKSGRTLTGTTPEIMVEVLEGLSVDALGINCSLGPKELKDTAERVLAAAHIPVIIQPNRGLPRLRNGKTYYDLSLDEFSSSMSEYFDMGAAILGGCCGTTPEFISALSHLKGLTVKKRSNPYFTAVTSSVRLLRIEDVRICGERLNPTGKKRIKEAILAGDYDLLISEALSQEEAGADLLDINVGIPKIDEPAVMRAVLEKIQEYTDLPLQIDSSSSAAIEAGARHYNGIPLINSVNGKQAVMDRIFPIVKKYGAVVLGLTLDENGIPRTARERFEIARRIIKEAEKYGIPKHKIMIDTLVLTASAEQDIVKETLSALSMVRELGVMTALGVSNVSFGLPNRPLINRTFLTMAMQSGLSMPILNPLDAEMTGAVKAFKVLSGIDKGSEEYIDSYSDPQKTATKATATSGEAAKTLFDAVVRGLKGDIAPLTVQEIEKSDPLSVINEILIPALNKVGCGYSEGRIFLPKLISSAEAAKAAFEVVTERMPALAIAKETVVMATVKGDVHDIGKNIVKTVLRSYGYHVIDLGRDVSPERILEAYNEHSPLAIGLSALMTTTVSSMEETIKLLRDNDCRAKIFVGGAVLNRETAKEIDADFYTEDALEFVKLLEGL